MHAYCSLEKRFACVDALQNAVGILQWDFETIMPNGAVRSRAEQLAVLKGLSHDLVTAPGVGELLDQARLDIEGLSKWQIANLREMRRAYLHASAVPNDLVQAS